MKQRLLAACRCGFPGAIWLLGSVGALAQVPVITSVAPASGPAGTSVTISGSGFAAAAAQNAVFVGQVRATITAASATQLTVTVPTGAGSPSLLTVTNTATGRQTSSTALRVIFAGALTTASYQRTDFPAPGDANDVVAADVDADGQLDVLSVSGTNVTAGSNVALFLNGGNGQLQAPIQLLAGFLPSQIEVADLNSDAQPDLVVGNAGSRDVAVLLGRAGGGFSSAQFPDLGGNGLADGTAGQRTLRVLDFDQDGLPDIAFIAGLNSAGNIGTLRLLRNTGAGFQLQPSIGVGNIRAVETGDFDGDGRPDLIGVGANGFTLLLRNATNTGYSPAEVVATTSFVARVLAVDFNQDGRTDVAFLRNNASPQGGYDLLLYLRTAAGTGFSAPAIFSSPLAGFPTTPSLAAGDADGDGKPDILVTDRARLSVWRNADNGQFEQPVSFTNPSGTRQAVAGDFDGDGRTDIITTTSANNLLSLYRYTNATPNQNNPPTLNPLSDLTLDEDAPQQTVALSGISNGGDAGQAVTLTAVSSDPSLVPNPTISYFSPTSTGTLRLQPAPNAFGNCTITVTASDGQAQNGTLPRTFRVTVNPVNDQPTLDAVPDVIINQASTTQIAVALSGITSGAANENQTLTLAAAVSLAGSGGAISNGSFTYTSPGTTGQYVLPVAVIQPGLYATVTLTVNDGQAGSNSFSRTFRIFYQPGSVAGAPTLDPIADVTANRSLPTQTPVMLTGIADGDPNQTLPLTVTATSSDPTLVTPGVVSYSSPASTGSLPYSISSTRSGTATVTVTVSNGQSQNGTITRSFRVTLPQVLSATAGRSATQTVVLYPNPASGGAFWLIGSAAGRAAVTVLDLAGRVVWQQQLASLQLPQQVSAALATGVYVVQVLTEAGTVSRKLTVQ